MSYQAQVPTKVADYFGDKGITVHPIVAEEFRPGRGWVRSPMRKRISRSWARKLRSEGVTAVQLSALGVLADFQIEEVIR